MDILTLTESGLGLDKFPVRITRIEEDESGMLTVTAEELSIGSRSAIEYDSQASNGYQGGNEEPGNVNAPSIFEPPLDLTDGKIKYGLLSPVGLIGAAVMFGQALIIRHMK